MVSIIIPIWNTSAFLNKCLSSVLSQTVQDWECILIDDGSEDGSYDICKEWCNRDSRFRLFWQKNVGVSAARNKGIIEARGETITFIDSDDTVSSSYLENLLSATDADLIVGGVVRIRNGIYSECIPYGPAFRGVFSIDRFHSTVFTDLNEKFLLYGIGAKLFDTAIIRRNNLFFSEDQALGEDLEFNYNYLEYVKTISTIPECDYQYYIRKDGESLSTIIRDNKFDNDLRQWRIIYTFYEHRLLLDETANKLLYRRMWEIVYGSIFRGINDSKPLNYYNSILDIPEIESLREYSYLYSCARWIKFLILNRLSFPFFLYGLFNRGR